MSYYRLEGKYTLFMVGANYPGVAITSNSLLMVFPKASSFRRRPSLSLIHLQRSYPTKMSLNSRQGYTLRRHSQCCCPAMIMF